MIAPEVIQFEARKHLGTPFRHQGRLPGVGLDCVGLLVMVARALGLEHVDRRAYTMRPDGHTLLETLRANPCLLELESPAHAIEGDVLVFEFAGPKWPQHAAIRTDIGMIHTYQRIGKVAEHGYDAEWRGRTTHAFRFKESGA